MGIVFVLPFLAAVLLFAIGVCIIATVAISQSGAMSLRGRIALWCKLCGIGVFIVCTFLWLVGAAIEMSYGGSTDGGRIDGDRYFLVSHGKYTEVSKDIWDFVARTEYWLGSRCWVVGAIGMVTFVLVGLLEKGRIVTNLAEGFGVADTQE